MAWSPFLILRRAKRVVAIKHAYCRFEQLHSGVNRKVSAKQMLHFLSALPIEIAPVREGMYLSGLFQQCRSLSH